MDGAFDGVECYVTERKYEKKFFPGHLECHASTHMTHGKNVVYHYTLLPINPPQASNNKEASH